MNLELDQLTDVINTNTALCHELGVLGAEVRAIEDRITARQELFDAMEIAAAQEAKNG